MDNDQESIRYSVAVTTQRIALQNRCVDLSITVTLALAGSIFALIFKEPNTTPTHIPFVTVLILFFYVFIQLLLLANYIYHTIAIKCFDYTYGQIAWDSSSKGIQEELLKPDTNWLFNKIASLVERFQLAVLYVSIAMGLLVVAAITIYVVFRASCGTMNLLPPMQTTVFFQCVPVITTLYAFVLGFLILVHQQAERFARSRLRLTKRRWERNTQRWFNDNRSTFKTGP